MTAGHLDPARAVVTSNRVVTPVSVIMPVLNEVGVQLAGEPEVFEVHVLEQPRTTTA